MTWRSLICTFAALQGTSAFNLAPGVEISGSYSVDRVISLDYDHDGLRDLVLIDQSRDLLRVILQVSPRVFAEEPVLVEPLNVEASVEKADLNRDGFDDLVIHENGTVKFLVSNANGFIPLPEFEIGPNRLDLKAVGDFDQDGELDLAFFSAPHEFNQEINNQLPRIYWGVSEGVFEESPLILETGDPADPFRMRHLQNLRGKVDGFRVFYRSGQALVTLTKSREFQVTSINSNTQILVDVNGDDLLDGVAMDSRWVEGERIYDLLIRSGLKEGGFSEAEVSSFQIEQDDFDPIGFFYLSAGDLDGDGDQDLVFSRQHSAGFCSVINLGEGEWEATLPFRTSELIVGLEVMDLDEDGRSDVVTKHAGQWLTDCLGWSLAMPRFANESFVSWSDRVRQFTQFSEGEMLGKTLRALRPQWVDQNGDGYEDLFFGDYLKGELIRLQGTTETMDFDEVPVGITQGRRLLDFDVTVSSDGGSSSVLTVSKDVGFDWFLPSSGDRFWLQDNPYYRYPEGQADAGLDSASVTIWVPSNFVRRINLGSDLDFDFITINPRNSDLLWYRVENGSWATPRAILRGSFQKTNSEGLSYSSVAVGDCDGDGLDEIFLSNWESSGGVRMVRYLPDEDEFEEAVLMDGFPIQVLRLADLDGDGDLDLMGLWESSGTILVSENIEGEFGEPIRVGSGFWVVDFAVGDLDQDGLPEIVTGAGLTSDALGNPVLFTEIGYVRQLAPMVFGEAIKIADALGPCTDLLVVDVNRDGRLDVVQASRPGATIEVFLNEETVPVIGLAEWLSIHGEAEGDPDGDGRSNLVEYYFGTDPAVKDGGQEFEFRQGPGFYYAVNPYFTAKRRRDLDPREWILFVEGSRDLIRWREEPWEGYRSVIRDSTDPEMETVRVRFDPVRGDQYFRWRLEYRPLNAE